MNYFTKLENAGDCNFGKLTGNEKIG